MKLRTEKEIISNWKRSKFPLVSISCVTYNHENYIAECIESFLSQDTDFAFEILIHDDASNDNTPLIIEKYVENYPNIVLPIYQKENQYSKNIKPNLFNFDRAKGQYIAFCDGDDFWSSKKKLSTQVNYMKEFKECNVSFHGVKVIHNDKRIEERLTNIKPHVYSLGEIILKDHHLVFSSSSIMIKYEVINNIPNFYKMAPVEDYYLRILGAMKGGGLYIPQILSSYRRFTPNSFTLMHKRSTDIALKNFNTMKEVRKYLNKSIFSVAGFKVTQFAIKYLILRFYNKLKNR